MKILEIIPQLCSGGGERFTVDLCNELSKRHEVVLAVLHPLKDNIAFYLPQVSPSVKVISLHKHLGVDIKLLFRVYKLVKDFQPDVIHTHLNGIIYAAWAIIKYHQSVRCVHTVHNAAKQEAGSGIVCMIRRFLIKHGWVTAVTISKESLRSFMEFYGMSAPMIDNGRDIPANIKPSTDVQNEVNAFKKDANTRVLVQIARFISVKRQSMMAQVADRLYGEGYNLCVLMIGRDGEETAKVKQIASPCVHMLGQRTNPLEYLAAADAYVLCSTFEGMPISFIEALGVGTIPVCTPVGGIINVVKNGVNGLLSKDISEESYYKTLKYFLEMSDEQRQAMKQAVLESYAPFSMTTCAAKYEELYNK